jgi:hypothetical protein
MHTETPAVEAVLRSAAAHCTHAINGRGLEAVQARMPPPVVCHLFENAAGGHVRSSAASGASPRCIRRRHRSSTPSGWVGQALLAVLVRAHSLLVTSGATQPRGHSCFDCGKGVRQSAASACGYAPGQFLQLRHSIPYIAIAKNPFSREQEFWNRQRTPTPIKLVRSAGPKTRPGRPRTGTPNNRIDYYY